MAAFVARADSGAREGKLPAQRVKQRTARAHLLCQGASCDELQSAKAFCGVQRPPTSLPACSSRRGASSAPSHVENADVGASSPENDMNTQMSEQAPFQNNMENADVGASSPQMI